MSYQGYNFKAAPGSKGVPPVGLMKDRLPGDSAGSRGELRQQ